MFQLSFITSMWMKLESITPKISATEMALTSKNSIGSTKPALLVSENRNSP